MYVSTSFKLLFAWVRVLLAAGLIALTPSPAIAQAAQVPPEAASVDENAVDVQTGNLEYADVTVSIGEAGGSPLEYQLIKPRSQSWNTAGFIMSETGAVSVSVGNASERFTFFFSVLRRVCSVRMIQ